MTWSKLSHQFGAVLPVFVLLWVVCAIPQIEERTGLSMLSEFAFSGFAIIAIYFQIQLLRMLFSKFAPKHDRTGESDK